MAKATGLGWEEKVIARTTGTRCNLKTLDGYYIVPRKLSYEAMKRIFQLNKIKVDLDKITEEDVKAVEENVKDQVKKMQKEGKNIFEDTNLIELSKISFLNGVEDHNFYIPVYVRNEDGTLARDEDGDLLAEEDVDGSPRMVKSVWNDELYKKIMARDFEIIIEISMIVTAFNRTTKKKSSRKSGMRSNGSTKK